MPEQSIIVWDIETVPDLGAAARMLDMTSSTEAEVREAIGDGFPKHPLHKIVCIGALVRAANPKVGVSTPLERLTSASGRRQS